MDTQLSWFDKLSNIAKEFLPVASFVASVFFPGAGEIGKAIAAVPKLMDVAEGMFGSGAGVIKSDFVLKSVKDLVSIGSDFSTGGQAETFKKLETLVPAISASIITGVNTYEDPTVDSVGAAIAQVAGTFVEVAKAFDWQIVSNPGV
jgi:hypothetical protein